MHNTAVRRSSLALAALALLAACTGEPSPTAPNTFVVPLLSQGSSDGTSHHSVAPLSGDEEVPPVDTRAVGNAIFWLSEDGTSLRYRLITSRMEDITQSHIHIAPAGVNGPVVVFLFGFVTGGQDNAGILAEGTITAANLIARPAIGFGATMPELVAAMRSGNAYVNVHTTTWPGGEIRGQVKEAGPSR
jgi:hypothetical protein